MASLGELGSPALLSLSSGLRDKSSTATPAEMPTYRSGTVACGRQAFQPEARRSAGRAVRGSSKEGVGVAERRSGGAGDGGKPPCLR